MLDKSPKRAKEDSAQGLGPLEVESFADLKAELFRLVPDSRGVDPVPARINSFPCGILNSSTSIPDSPKSIRTPKVKWTKQMLEKEAAIEKRLVGDTAHSRAFKIKAIR